MRFFRSGEREPAHDVVHSAGVHPVGALGISTEDRRSCQQGPSGEGKLIFPLKAITGEGKKSLVLLLFN